MRRFRGLSIAARVGIVIGAIGLGGAATVGAVVLPSQANDHATTSTSSITTGRPTSAPTPAGTPAAQAAFGQCVAANAETASDNGGQDWNPTVGCTKPGSAASAANEGSGLENATSHANDAASDGLSTAAAGGDNGASHANDNGVDEATARGDNAETHP
jgi:hypothetical protein